MIFNKTKLEGAFIISLEEISDERGFFGRTWCKNEMESQGLKTNIVQINTQFSHKKGTLRGMHFQKRPFEETKFVRCTKGSVYDVIIDLREESPTFMKWFGAELSEKNHKMFYVPERFAHGFVTLEDNTEVTYFTTNIFSQEHAFGVRYNDPKFGINWPVDIMILSAKDKNAEDFNRRMLP